MLIHQKSPFKVAAGIRYTVVGPFAAAKLRLRRPVSSILGYKRPSSLPSFQSASELHVVQNTLWVTVPSTNPGAAPGMRRQDDLISNGACSQTEAIHNQASQYAAQAEFSYQKIIVAMTFSKWSLPQDCSLAILRLTILFLQNWFSFAAVKLTLNMASTPGLRGIRAAPGADTCANELDESSKIWNQYSVVLAYWYKCRLCDCPPRHAWFVRAHIGVSPRSH